MAEQLITPDAVRQVLRDFTDQYRAYPWYSLAAFLMPATGTIFVFFVPPLIVGRLINIFVADGTISLTTAAPYIFAFASLWMLGEIFWRIGFHYLVKIEANAFYNLGRIVFKRLSDRDYDFYANNFVGSLTKKAMAFSRNFETFTDTLAFSVTNNIFPILFALIVLWQYSPWLPFILVMWIVIALVVALPIIRRRAHLVSLRHDASSRVAGKLSDAIGNMIIIKSFAKEKWELENFSTYVADFTDKYRRAANFQNLRFDTVISPIYVLTNTCGLIAAVLFAEQLGLSAGAIMIIFSYYALTTRVLWEINKVYRQFESSVSEAAELTQLFLTAPLIEDAPRATTLHVKNGAIRFNKITFTYSGNDEHTPFLRDLSLQIEGHQKIGLVGPSGGGKTTMTKLLLRFVDVNSGTITIDDTDIQKVSQVSLREAIGYVPQEPLLFHRSLLENIAYGNSKASKKEIVRAAKIAHADEFINQLPQGYETLVGERGVKLSGGQRQRIAIARALLKNAPILILDEATSSLDSESEKYIQEGLWELMKGKTALVIAHRLSTIKHLDRIIVLDQGRIVQDGTHEELIHQKGLYVKLWEHQSGGFLES
ncbi:MAG: ABC transporter ATP-binding protein [Patescibacteria group bacterium]